MHNLIGSGLNKVGFKKLKPGVIKIVNQAPIFLIPLGIESLPHSIKVLRG